MIRTIGHSVRPLDDFLGMLRQAGIELLADVRTIPRSRRNPQFNQQALAAALQSCDIAYRHLPGLGGMRKPRPDSINQGLKNEGFRGYADYMQTPEFEHALEDLLALAAVKAVALMCAEAQPSQCHRSLVADALITRGVAVGHLVSRGTSQPHRLTPAALVQNGKLSYPFTLQSRPLRGSARNVH